MYKNFIEINEIVSTFLKENKPFAMLRIDNTAGYVMHCLSKGSFPDQQFYNEHTLIEAGIYPVSMQYAYNVVNPKTIEIMKQCDILGFVDISGEIKRDNRFLNQFPDIPMFFGDDFLIVDPGALLGYSIHGNVQNPWTENLAGKKVLVISSHYESIMRQWENIDKVWGNNKNKIVPFDFVGCIRTPHHPLIDSRQNPNCNTWEDTIEYTKSQLDSYDYDVVLTSTSHQSPFYAVHAKEKGKVGIQTGGVLQLFFGVLGNRWTKAPIYQNWAKMYNEHWIYPFKNDEPQEIGKIRHLETSFAYWG